MCVVLGRPPVDEEASWDEERAGDHEGDSEFGSPCIIVFLFQASVYTVIDGRADLGSEE